MHHGMSCFRKQTIIGFIYIKDFFSKRKSTVFNTSSSQERDEAFFQISFSWTLRVTLVRKAPVPRTRQQHKTKTNHQLSPSPPPSPCWFLPMSLRRGAVVFHRHGHRAPARSIVVNHDEEIKLWSSLTKAEEIHGELCKRFPIINANISTPKDLTTAPFGLITQKGLLSLELLGRNIAGRFPHLAKTTKLQVFATNYQRTQASAQQLLTGLFHSIDQKRLAGPSTVNVRSTYACPMSFYEGNPTLSNQLLQLSQSSADFIEREESDEIRRLRDTLLNVLPGLLVTTTNKFDWMAAFDYYVCRESHDVSIAPQIASYTEPVKRHLTFRYGHYCTNKHHLAHICVPLLLDLRSALVTILSEDSPNDVSLSIFSGHDVSILALLYCFQAKMVTSSSSTVSPAFSSSSFWPMYGSSLVFDVRPTSSSSNTSTSTSALVDVYYDLEPLPIKLPGSYHTTTTSTPNIASFTLDDLNRCIDYMSRDFITI